MGRFRLYFAPAFVDLFISPECLCLGGDCGADPSDDPFIACVSPEC